MASESARRAFLRETLLGAAGLMVMHVIDAVFLLQ
jgi:hypothetical protein